MGSGHILVYMFDVLVQIYEAYGYSTREAVQSILENNLYGLDIDDRAAQLAYFAVMMKARQYDRRFFTRGIQPHVCAIQESARMLEQNWGAFGAEEGIARRIHAAFVDAKEYGSLICPDVTPEEIHALRHRIVQMQGLDPNTMSLGQLAAAMAAIDVIAPQMELAEMLCRKYDVVVTNPPYRGMGDVDDKLNDYAKAHFPDSSSDLSTIFMEQCYHLASNKGFLSMINIPVWMSLGCYSSLRRKVVEEMRLLSMLHLGRGMFGSDYGTTAFVISKKFVREYAGLYKRFFTKQSAVDSEETKRQIFFGKTKDYITKQSLFERLPNYLIAYWASNAFADAFCQGKGISEYATVFEGLKTRDKDRFLRFWFEVSDNKWKPYAKGGSFRRWYGNNDYVVNWGDRGDEVRAFKKSSGANFAHYFKPCITYTAMTMSKFTGRYIENQIFGGGGGGISNSEIIDFLLGFVNSKPFDYIISAMKSTVNFEVGQIGRIPVLGLESEKKKEICCLSMNNVTLSRNEWDSFEYSWDFQRHPLLQYASLSPKLIAEEEQNGFLVTNTMEEAYRYWEQVADERFQQLKSNEEELNRIFIDIYGLQDELSPEVEDRDVTVRRADLGRDVRSFISYAVGCMFGRYSIYKPGLMFAGEPYSLQAFVNKLNDQPGVVSAQELERAYRNEGIIVNEMFYPDADGILPITDDEYFDDDIVGRFVQFVETVYGRGTLEENLKFIAGALGGSGTPRQVIRSYFLNDFYADHLKIYQKRPIYWLFDSGKKNGFKCLIYMHRYAPDTIARIRTDYVHEQQSRYRTAIADLEKRAAAATTAERVKLTKQLTKIKAQAEELRLYEEKIHHLADQMLPIDLDDGVKVNYARFQDVLAKIK